MASHSQVAKSNLSRMIMISLATIHARQNMYIWYARRRYPRIAGYDWLGRVIYATERIKPNDGCQTQSNGITIPPHYL
jgi:hypothetical protein